MITDRHINAPGHGRSTIDGIILYDKTYLKQKMRMIGTEDSKNENMRINAAYMICDKNQEFKFKRFAEECFKVCLFENSKTCVKGLLKHN